MLDSFLKRFASIASAEIFDFTNGKKFGRVKFDFVDDLFPNPLEVNGTGLTFMLDKGEGISLLFNRSNNDSIRINTVSEISVRSLGTGEPAKGLVSVYYI